MTADDPSQIGKSTTVTEDSATPARTRTNLRPLILMASGAATLIAALAIIVPPMIGAAERTTDADALEVRGSSSDADAGPFANAVNLNESLEEVNNESMTYWRIPVSASLSSFPADNTPHRAECSAAELAWLKENAIEVDVRENLVTLRNAAETGGSLSIQNIRFAGVEVEDEPWVMLRCPRGGIGDAGPQPIVVPVDGSAATWGTAYPESDNLWPPGSPATLNLAPGEVYRNYFIESGAVAYDQRGPVVGELADSGETVILIEDLRVDRPAVRGYVIGWDFGVDEFSCWVPHPDGGEDQWGRANQVHTTCTLAEAEDLLRTAAESGR